MSQKQSLSLLHCLVRVFHHSHSKRNQGTYYCFLRRAFKILSVSLTHGSMFLLLISTLSQAFKSKAALFLFLLQAAFVTVVLCFSSHSQWAKPPTSFEQKSSYTSSCCSSGQFLIFSLPHGCDLSHPLLFEEMSPCF